jgi:Sulfotransferase family
MDEITRLKHALTIEPLLDAAFAEARTGAKEFRDGSFLSNLKKTLEIPTRLNMSARGLMGVHANFTRFLVNRLRWEADVEKHPEILEEDVSDPIVVLGLPRSGTTKLQRFLSTDPHVQATPAWAMFNPAPFPGEAPGDPAPRIAWANKMMAAVTNTGESYQIMHEFAALEADETSFIPLAQFDNVMQFITTPDYPHLQWTRSVSRIPSQAYLKEMLKYLQWQDGGKRERIWILKNPGNTGEIAEMLQLFPSATFVISERDLYKTMASSMRMGTEILRNTLEPLDLKFVGNYTVDYWAHELKRFLAQRKQLDGKIRLVETPYKRCVSDAISVAREVYERAGRPWTRKGEAAMRRWDIDNPRHKLGSYDYALEDYGWSESKVAEAFGPVAEEWRGR